MSTRQRESVPASPRQSWFRASRSQVAIEPYRDVVRDRDGYRSLGTKPLLDLIPVGAVLPSGWAVLSLHRLDGAPGFRPTLELEAGPSDFDPQRIPLNHVGSRSFGRLIHLPPGLRALRLQPLDAEGAFHLDKVTLRECGRLELWGRMLIKALQRALRHPSAVPALFSAGIQTLMRGGSSILVGRLLGSPTTFSHDNYQSWIDRYDILSASDRRRISQRIRELPYQPLISVIMPVHDPNANLLARAIESVQTQLYQNWQLCIADDASADSRVREVLSRYSSEDDRLKVTYRETKGHISAASNTALGLATGEFVALLDHDDELSEHALYLVVEALNEYPDADIVFSDEDKIDGEGNRSTPHFKPDLSPDSLLSHNCISHLCVYRSSLLRRIGGFREGYEGSQDWDLVLRAIEQSSPDRIHHVPFVLYHWRITAGSAASGIGAKPYALESARRTIRAHLRRRGVDGTVKPAPIAVHHRVKYAVGAPPPRVAIIIPSTDQVGVLEACIESIDRRTDYSNYEIIVVGRDGPEADQNRCLRRLERSGRARLLSCDQRSSRPALDNWAAEQASGDVIVFLDNRIAVISSGWLRELVSLAIREETGAVGAKLVGPSGLLEHAGMVLDRSCARRALLAGFPGAAEGYFGKAHLIQNFSAVAAACMGVRREVFQEVGGFDEELSMASADIDLCLRLRSRGYWIAWSPHILMQHESPSWSSDAPSNSREQVPERERRLYSERWGGFEDPFYNSNLSLEPHQEFQLAFPPRVRKPWL